MNGQMLNDLSTPLSLLETRRSGRPRELVGPSPSPEELERILTIAARVPDHGKLQPWRFVTVADDQREALADVLLGALQIEVPESGPAHRDKEIAFAHYSGQLVVLLSAPVPNHKIPVWEQELSAGAAGMNLLLAAHAMGFVAGWVTGWRTYSQTVRAAFCGPGERIAGFIFIGEAERPLEDRPRPALDEVVRKWSPPAV
jgi:nitroreductase